MSHLTRLAMVVAGLALALSAAVSPASAQTPPQAQAQTPASDSLAAQAAAVDQAQADLRTITADLHARRLGDADLKARLGDIPAVQAHLAAALDVLTPKLTDVDARLAQLGPAPAAGQPAEDPETAAARRNLTRFRGQVDTEIKQARLLNVEAAQAAKRMADQLRRNFAERLWTQSRSVVDPTLWRDFAAALPTDLTRLRGAASGEARPLADAARSSAQVIYWLLAGVLALLLLGPARVVLNTLGYRRAAAGPASDLRRSSLALWRVLVVTLTPLAAGIVARGALAGALTPEFLETADLLIRVVVFAAFLQGLGRAVLSPRRPEWRLAPVPDKVAARLAPFAAAIGVAAGLATLAAGVNSIFAASLPTSIAADCLTLLGEILAVGGALAMVGAARTEHLAHGDTAPTPTAAGRLPWVLAALAAWLALGAAMLAVLTGYLALAGFLIHETIWIGAVLAATFLLLRFADHLFPALLSPASPVGGAIKTAIGVSDGALDQIAVLLSGLVRLGLLLIGWTTILAPFGASADDIVGRVTATDWVLHVGQVAISPGAVFGALALLFIGLLFTRAVRAWLETRYLPKTAMDVGVRTSLAAAVSYGGVIIAILFAFAYLGLSFSQIALFASALSVGIGFGLQAIINNFVSGLILLVERPIKVGDWIAIGDLEGDVKSINIRATEIEMMDRSKLIVPNSDLIAKTVRNVTHGAVAARLRIMLRTDATVDPVAMRDLMIDRIKAHPEILAQPAPAVFLSDVRDGALEFTAFAYVASARAAYRVKSELLFQIVPDMKARGIALASSTPVVNIGLPDRLIEPETGSPA
jgi:small-conductance mechanosensitive channel